MRAWLKDLGADASRKGELAVVGGQIGQDKRFEDLFPGTRLVGPYRLERRIASGGMGEVWLARHHLLRREVAVKLIRAEALRNGRGAQGRHAVEALRKRFEREAQATASLTSPHTIDLYDFGVLPDGSFYYVMPCLEGRDLEALVQRYGPVPVGRSVYLLTQACESLAEAHEHHLIHRDVKPSNIFVTRQGIAHDFVKVLDFGLVKDIDVHHAPATLLTLDGVASGTPAYMPPEIALARPNVDGRADVYALGCVGYWLVTGQRVFPGHSAVEMVVGHVKSAPAAPSTRTELPIPGEFDAVILRALGKEPADRFQSMRDFAEALHQVPIPEPWSAAKAERWWALVAPRQTTTQAFPSL